MATQAIADWPALMAEYVQGRMSIAELAQAHGLKEDTVKKQNDRHKWGAKRLEFQQLAVAKAAETASIERVSDLLAFNKDDLKVARAIRARVARRLGAIDQDIPSNELRMLASAAEAAQRMGRLALGASTDNIGHPVGAAGDAEEFRDIPVDEYLRARARAIEDV